MTTVENRGRHVDVTVEDGAAFAGVVCGGEVEMFTADELRELAREMERVENAYVDETEDAS